MAENVLYYGDNYEHRTGRAIHKRGPLGFLGYNRWPYFLFNLSACPCFCPCQSVSMKYSAAISKANRLTLSILIRLSRATRIITSFSPSATAVRPPLKSRHCKVTLRHFGFTSWRCKFTVCHCKLTSWHCWLTIWRCKWSKRRVNRLF